VSEEAYDAAAAAMRKREAADPQEQLAKYLLQCERVLIQHLREKKGWPVDLYNIRIVAVDPKHGA
jgi:hypothetical protein